MEIGLNATIPATQELIPLNEPARALALIQDYEEMRENARAKSTRRAYAAAPGR